MTADPQWSMAIALLIAWLAASAYWLRPRRRATGSADTILILHASQTGQALELAQATSGRLIGGGRKAMLAPLGGVDASAIAASRQVLAIVATTGVGEAPDEARAFAKQMESQVDLSGTSFAILALGDRRYDDYCAFGVRVDDWFAAGGAKRLHGRIDVDDLDNAALRRWDMLLDSLGAAGVPEAAPLYDAWRIEARERLNPSDDAAIPGLWQLRLSLEKAKVNGALPDWQSGDLFEVMTPGGHRRDYSIASLPTEGNVALLVRSVRDEAGMIGEGSGLLTEGAAVGSSLKGRLRVHTGFHSPAGEGPVLLIAAGSGFAGIRPHALRLAEGGRPVWMILGERRPDVDARITEEVSVWEREGRLSRLDLVFSRAGDDQRRYVQHVVGTEAKAVRAYLGQFGAVMLCGGLAMGKAVEAALTTALGSDWIATARAEGRMRTDLY